MVKTSVSENNTKAIAEYLINIGSFISGFDCIPQSPKENYQFVLFKVLDGFKIVPFSSRFHEKILSLEQFLLSMEGQSYAF